MRAWKAASRRFHKVPLTIENAARLVLEADDAEFAHHF
jgi:hypothetical protein